MPIFQAPAKINLFLHVVGRRSDGYHLLESVFALIDLCDTVGIEPTKEGRVGRDREIAGVSEDADLTLKAAKLLQSAANVKEGAVISVQKRIPMGAGLGGGSSDAATVLTALNRLWNVNLPVPELRKIALQLGADVPFFVGGHDAFVTGIGENLTPVELPKKWVALAKPPVFVPTREIFADEELTRDTPSEKIRDFPVSHGRNDLEPVAVKRYPAIAKTLAALRSVAPDARMSGSGSACFALFDEERDARQALEALPDEDERWAVKML